MKNSHNSHSRNEKIFVSNMKPPVVVITGASAGVGRATAHAFARQGAFIGLLARGTEGLEAAREEAEALGGRAVAIPTDVANAQQVEHAASRVEDELGPIDIWVNNAMTTIFASMAWGCGRSCFEPWIGRSPARQTLNSQTSIRRRNDACSQPDFLYLQSLGDNNIHRKLDCCAPCPVLECGVSHFNRARALHWHWLEREIKDVRSI